MDAQGTADPPFGETSTPPRVISNNNIRVKELQREQLCRRVVELRENLLHLNTMTPSQLETKLALLEHHFTTFERVQSELEFLDESQFDLDHRTVFEESFCDVKSAIAERIAEFRRRDGLSSTRVPAANFSSSSTPPARHSLPKLQLTKFSGKYTEWIDFYNMFRALVHNNAGLDDIEKFQYLRSCLLDSAFRLIQSLEVTNENYHRALELLVSRYDNKRYIFQSHLQAIFDNGALNHPTVTSLREFIDSINAHLRAIPSMASRIQIADGILLHLIVAKLDHETQLKWEEEVSTKWDNSATTSLQLPSWDDLAMFIERRCQTVNMVNASKSASGKVTTTKTSVRSSKVSSALVTSSNNNKCPLCDEIVTHSAFKCDKFTTMDPIQRYDLAKKKNLCLNCLGKNRVSSKCPSTNRCQYCKVSHHSLLHRNTSSTSPTSPTSPAQEPKQAPAVALIAHQPTHDVILATAIVKLHNNRGTSILARALLDSASQLNFVSERIAQILKASRNKVAMEISGIGTLRTKANYVAVVGLNSVHTGFSSLLEAVIMPSISSIQPRTTIDISHWGIPKNINLADNSFHIPSAIDVLLGASIFFDILSVGQIKLHKNLPTLQKTQLGWIVSGALSSHSPLSSSSVLTSSSLPHHESSSLTNSSLELRLEQFWEIEDNCYKSSVKHTSAENECEEHFRQNTTRCLRTNKFIVRLPFIENPVGLGNSLETARRRFFAMEKRLENNQEMQREYKAFMQEYIELHHMVPVNPSEVGAKVGSYIPHHCVVKVDSSTTKLRVVFDASCRTSNGKSLNDILHVGPTLQDDIFKILLRFRTHRFVLIADIAKMYRQILVDPRDAKWQCILWRNSPSDPLTVFQLQTVTYGTSSAPFLAVRCLQQLAHENMEAYPVGAPITLRDFYVDNLMTGGSTVEEVLRIKSEVTALLASGGFPLRKFASNCNAIIADISSADMEEIITVDDMNYIKALGLKWSPTSDHFLFSYRSSQFASSRATKRTILAQVASFFDPLGLLNPIIVKCKILMQRLWKLSLAWDESVPLSISTEWEGICQQLSLVNRIKVPRYVCSDNNTNVHAFSDASGKAYGACIYAVSYHDNAVHSTLICAKSRVAPTKEITLPKLELCAALLLSELLQSVLQTFSALPSNVHCWSDSTITLHWLQREPHHWTTFVANRVAKIQHITADFTWHHVPSEENPADLVSRGTSVEALMGNSLWFQGPEFLTKNSNCWPRNPVDALHEVPEQRKLCFSVTSSPKEDIIAGHKYVNSYNKILRIFAYIHRFISSLRHRFVESGPITARELDNSLLIVCRYIQSVEFADDYKSLHKSSVNRNSKLNQLSPFLHDEIIRVGGRISNSSLPWATKHPILLPKTHPFVRTLIEAFHRQHLHAGCQTLLSILRDRFWIINARSIIKQVIHSCILCYRNKPILEHQLMGALPRERVQPTYPFEVSGVDYCGPLMITQRIRSKGPLKVYVALFICFTTKAVHLELVPDLSTTSFVGALKRFIARRGKCRKIFSDNATNFVGANRELRELLSAFTSQHHTDTVQSSLAEQGIEWRFIPPRSPHFGGLWESAVKRAKHYLRRAVGSHLLTFDELNTVCSQTEAMINSRPLTPLSSSPDDLRALTPAHFLIGRSLTTVVEPSLQQTRTGLLSRYQIIQSVQQCFWERWQQEYLKELQQRTKWKTACQNLQKNDMVIIKEESTPPMNWPLGRVVDIFAGKDGAVRVVLIKTADGTYKRAITRVCKLPIDSSSPQHT